MPDSFGADAIARRVRQVVDALRVYKPERVYLFGSAARGEADELSDLDIVVIKRTSAPFFDRLEEVARRAALLTHSLVQMVDEVLPQVPRLAGLLEQARHLDLHYVPSRYPNGLPSGYPHQFYGKEMSERAIAAAEEMVGAVRVYYEQVSEGFSGEA